MSTSRQSQSFRSLEFMQNIFTKIKAHGHQDKPMQSALQNVVIIAVIGAVVGVCFVLGPFLKPLLWAFLFGAVLFPAKKKICEILNEWIDEIEQNDKHLMLGILMAPFQGMELFGKYISDWLVEHKKLLSIGCAAIFALRLVAAIGSVSSFFQELWNVILWNHAFFGSILEMLSMALIVFLLASYMATVFFFWTEQNASIFTILGQGLWVLIIGYLCSYLGAIQVPLFIIVLTYGLIGIIYEMKNDSISSSFLDKCKHIFNADSSQILNGSDVVDESIIPESSKQASITEIKSKMQLNLTGPGTSSKDTKDSKEKTENESDIYFRILFYSCGAAIVWKHVWIFFLCLIPIFMYTIKVLCKKLGIFDYLEQKFLYFSGEFLIWLQPRRTALLPLCLPGVFALNHIVHQFVCSKLKSYIDDISSIVMILLLIVSVVFLSVFAFFQIYSETIAVAQLGGNLVNRTLTHRPDLIEMLPIDLQSMDNIIDNAYKYGRTTIEDYVDGIFNQTDPTQAKKLKCQILSVWDRLIQSYMDRNNHDTVGPRVTTDSIASTIDEIVNNSVTKAGLIGFVKSNIGMLLEVADSLWILLRTNLSLLLSAIGTLVSVLLGGGHAVIKFLLNTIIFFTTLYYLLQSSQDRYAPIAINISSSWGNRVAEALEDSVSSVLVATLKLSLFHGLFTWLTHTVFGAHIIYLPAVLASLLAAAPFLETYWCSVPAFLDLWLSQDRLYLGLVLVLIHFIVPSNFNYIMYSEIKGGGHSYLTGLSIAGGIYLLGLEGAVLGPLLLCLLVVLFEVSMTSFKETPSPATRQSSLEDTTELYSPALNRYSALQELT